MHETLSTQLQHCRSQGTFQAPLMSRTPRPAFFPAHISQNYPFFHSRMDQKSGSKTQSQLTLPRAQKDKRPNPAHLCHPTPTIRMLTLRQSRVPNAFPCPPPVHPSTTESFHLHIALRLQTHFNTVHRKDRGMFTDPRHCARSHIRRPAMSDR